MRAPVLPIAPKQGAVEMIGLWRLVGRYFGQWTWRIIVEICLCFISCASNGLR